MRRYGWVLAVIALLAPSLSNSQVRQADDMSGTQASGTDDAVGTVADPPVPKATNERRSLMGMVMDVLIASAEQQAARQHAMRQPDRANAKATKAAAAPAAQPAPNPASPSDLATHEQVAVESKP